MRRILAAVFLLSGLAFAQGVRFGDQAAVETLVQDPNLRTSTGVTPKFVTATGPATISFCISPANGVPCTNKATTYTDSTLLTACSTATQLTIADSNSCVGQTDVNGHWGVWANPGQYEYTITISGASSGPFPATLGGSGGGGGGGTVTAVSGTVNQIAVATPLTTPVISITSPFVFPGDATFNRLISSSSNAATSGSIQFGPTDPIFYGCTTCAVSPITGSATNQNLIRGNGASGPAKVGDYQGISIFSEQIKGATSGTVTIQTQAVAGTWALTLPVNAGAAGQCLTTDGAGISSWAACAGGGGGNVTTIPGAGVSQNILQLKTTSFGANVFEKTRFVDASWNWSQSPAGTLSIGANTVTLTPCPLGIDTTNFSAAPYYISVNAGTEYAQVTGGTCTSGLATGTIVFTTLANYIAGFTVGSASTGIQEAWNDSCKGLDYTNSVGGNCEVQLQSSNLTPNAIAANYTIGAPVFLSQRNSAGFRVAGNHAVIKCLTRSKCIYVGNTNSSTTYGQIENLTVQSAQNQDGVNISDVTAAAGTFTVHTTTAHPFSMTANAGGPDYVDVNFYVGSATGQHVHSIVKLTSVADNTHFTFVNGATTFANAAGFGWAVLENAMIEDNAESTYFNHVRYLTDGTHFASYVLVDDNDQHMTIEDFTNTGGAPVACTSNFCGALLYARGDSGNSGIMYISHSSLSMQCGGNAVQAISGNGVVISDTIVQGQSQYGLYLDNSLVPSVISNVYQENSSACHNPYYSGSVNSATGLFVHAGNNRVNGNFPISGGWPTFATGGGGGSQINYFVVPRSSTLGFGAIFPIGIAQPLNGGVSIPLTWPNVALGNDLFAMGTITWDILATTSTTYTPLNGTQTIAVATNQAATCGSNGMCTFTDTQGARSSYVINATGWTVPLWWWPGTEVLYTSTLFMDVAPGQGAISNYGETRVSIYATECSQQASNQPTMFTPIWISCPGTDPNAASGLQAMVLQRKDANNNGAAANSKGRINLGSQEQNFPNTAITLSDQNFALTTSTKGMRPLASSGDTDIGFDAPGIMVLHGQVGVRSYVATLPNNSSWLEDLTSTTKTFKVPVVINNGATSGYVGLTQGTANSTTANTVGLTAPAAVTAYNYVFPASGTDGLLTGNLSGSTVTASFSGDSNHSIHLTGQTASLGATTICPATAGGCNVAGMYKISGYIVSTASCGTPGPGAIAPLLTWNDGTSSKAAVAIPVSTDASQTATAGSVALGSVGTHWGYFVANVWSAGGAALQVSATYTACTAGTGTYEIDATVIQLQ